MCNTNNGVQNNTPVTVVGYLHLPLCLCFSHTFFYVLNGFSNMGVSLEFSFVFISLERLGFLPKIAGNFSGFQGAAV